MENIDTATLEVNKLARRLRHMRNFSRWMLLRSYFRGWARVLAWPGRAFKKTKLYTTLAGFYLGVKESADAKLMLSPQRRLFFQSVALASAAIIATSFSPTATFSTTSYDYSDEYLNSYFIGGDVLVADESGYLVKINPQTGSANRVGMTDFAVHTVESGETLSVIAQRYAVKTETIMWQNNLVSAHALRTGQKLMVPPVDGISHKVASGETLDKLATKFKIESAAIVAQNSLESEVLRKGQNIFLPGAKPVAPPVNYATRNPAVSRSGRTSFTGTNSKATPVYGKIFIFPTTGTVTQGYRGGHYALDIGDRSKPPIWAAGAGTIVKASSGTWGGGYGNHVIVDHGNGLKSLYAHLDHLSVSVGQWVNQGDVLGQMGNTGRVYGATGIHLHWEVINNGVKQNPYNFF